MIGGLSEVRSKTILYYHHPHHRICCMLRFRLLILVICWCRFSIYVEHHFFIYSGSIKSLQIRRLTHSIWLTRQNSALNHVISKYDWEPWPEHVTSSETLQSCNVYPWAEKIRWKWCSNNTGIKHEITSHI